MAWNKVGLHVASNCGGCNGIETYWAKLNDAHIPFTVYAANDAGLITAAAKYAYADLIYRDVNASTVDPSSYERDPATEAVAYWEAYKLKLPISIREWKYRCWIELLNEPGKEGNQANWVGWLMFHMATRAIAEGYRVMGPGWSPGTPEPEHWYLPGWKAYLTLCRTYPDKVAVSLHEYSLDNDIHNGEPWLIGRFQFLMKACSDMDIIPPRIWITEAGWTLNSMPEDEQAKADIDYLAQLYADWPEIQSAHLWTLQAGAGNGNLPTRLNALMPWLTQYTIDTEFGDPYIPPPPPPDDPPDLPMTNQLFNPSFELEWYDATAFPGHIPQGWEVGYVTGIPNPLGGQEYMPIEAVKKHKGNLPVEEQNLFVWNGDWVYKVFGGGTKAFWAWLRQAVDLPAGVYKMTVELWVDHYHWKGYKDYNVDDDQAQARILFNDQDAPWVSLPSGGLRQITATITHPGGPLAVSAEMRSNWAINGNFWCDNWSLSPVAVAPPPPPPPPGKHKAIVVLLPQDVTADEMATCAREAHKNLHTMTPSHDDCLTMLNGGNSDSYAKIYRPGRQVDRVAVIEAAGYAWVEFLPEAVTPPFPSQRTRSMGRGL